MKFIKHLLLTLTVFFSIQAQAQVLIEGKLALGDLSQQHIVTTTTGDRFTGRVSDMRGNKLTLQYMGKELVFPLSEIEKIEVVGQQAGLDLPVIPVPKKEINQMTAEEAANYIWHFDYKITTLKGEEFMGKLIKFNEYGAVLDRGGAKGKTIPLKEVAAIERLGRKITDNPNELNEYQRMQTTQGNSYLGQLLSFDGETYGFLMKNGSEVKHPKSEVAFVRIERKNAAPLIYNRPQKTATGAQYLYNQQRLITSPTAFVLEKGVTEYRNLMIFHNTFDHGLTDNITVGAGLSTVIAANALSGKIKFGASLSRLVHVGVGAQGFLRLSTYGEGGQSVALLYGALTVGTKDKFITASVGLGKDSDYRDNTAGFSLGGSLRTSENWRIFLELVHWNPIETEEGFFYYQSNFTMGALGMSWFRGAHQVDFGLHTNNEISYNSAVAWPVAAYLYRF